MNLDHSVATPCKMLGKDEWLKAEHPMTLPNLSNAMYVARLRYIQSIHESPQYRNPDMLVRHFIPVRERWRTAWLGQEKLSKLRAEPFYYYLVARTIYYDHMLENAVANGVQQIVNVGCGTDTRAYRFKHLLRSKGVRILECDQPEAIHAKQRIAKRWRPCDYIEYLPIDLNDSAWPELGHWLSEHTASKALVLMEGVSPYVNASTFCQFLLLLATTLSAGSHVAYDFMIRGVNDDFGRVGRTQSPFRLSRASDEVATFHKAYSLRLERMELSAELIARMLPGLAESAACLYSEDGLVQLQVDRACAWGKLTAPARPTGA
jgi:methyltransferase (TIGR00027 family)